MVDRLPNIEHSAAECPRCNGNGAIMGLPGDVDVCAVCEGDGQVVRASAYAGAVEALRDVLIEALKPDQDDEPFERAEAIVRAAGLSLPWGQPETRGAADEERRRHDELHGCWECGTSDMRGNVCAEHEVLRGPSRDSRRATEEPS